MTHPPIVKVCCISSVAEAALAIEFGAKALGLVSAMPSGPGVIAESLIAEIAAFAPPDIATFLLTSLQRADAIAAQHAALRTSTVQLVDALTVEQLQRLRALLPDVQLVQVIHVADAQSLDQARAVSPHVDAILLDSGNPLLAVKELGGTGRTHDWALSRRIRDAISIPLFLAGGLHAGNVGEAIATVQPFGLDLCSGVRTNGSLDPAKLRAFMAAVAAAGPRADTSA